MSMSPIAAPQPKRPGIQRAALCCAVLEREAARAGLRFVHPQQAALRLHGMVYVGNIDVFCAVSIHITDAGIHAFVRIEPQVLEERALLPHESFSVLIEVAIIAAKIIGNVDICKAVLVQVPGSNSEAPARFHEARVCFPENRCRCSGEDGSCRRCLHCARSDA
jgi:hypothetical protein